MADNVLPFQSRRQQPDDDCRFTDEEGVDWFKFGLEYKFEDSLWAVEIMARDFDDAIKRAAAMKRGMIVVGQIYSKIDADNGTTTDAIVNAGGVVRDAIEDQRGEDE